MRQHPFSEFDMFLGPNVTDVYDWFGVDILGGVMKSDVIAVQKMEDKYIHSMVNYHPNDVLHDCSYKPYFFLNRDVINSMPINEIMIIIHSAATRLAAILCEGFTDLERVEEFAYDLSLAISNEINMPEVYMRI